MLNGLIAVLRTYDATYCYRPSSVVSPSAPMGRRHGNHFWLSVVWGAHWRHLANTTKPPMYGGNAAKVKLPRPLVYLFKLVFLFRFLYADDVGSSLLDTD